MIMSEFGFMGFWLVVCKFRSLMSNVRAHRLQKIADQQANMSTALVTTTGKHIGTKLTREQKRIANCKQTCAIRTSSVTATLCNNIIAI